MFTRKVEYLIRECTLGHQSLSACKVSDTYPLGCLRYRGKTFKVAVGVCCCLQTCNPVLNVLIMAFGLRQSLIVIFTTGILLHAKVCITRAPLLLFTRSLHCLQIFEHTNAHCTIKP